MNSIAESLQSHPADQPALEIAGTTWSYGDLAGLAGAVTRSVLDGEGGRLGLVSVLAEKSALAYAAIAGIHGAGLGYVPLNPRFPVARLASMLDQSGAGVLVVGPDCAGRAHEVLESIERSMLVVWHGEGERPEHPRHRYTRLGPPEPHTPSELMDDRIAYLLFTSGSTGQPKGVPVSFGNLEAYLGNVERLYPLRASDRCSQTFDLTFDLSVHDVFATLRAGATLCPLLPNDLLGAARFIRERELTTWFSVPTLAMSMARLRTLRAGALDRLRLSLFCGEALPATVAEAWSKAAPHSRTVNLYGPTEATIAITGHEWSGQVETVARRGLVPIGTPFPGQRGVLLDEDLEVIEGEGRGELALAGTQVTSGYLDAPEKTKDCFIELSEGPGVTLYRTGDLVERDAEGVLHYIARTDNQIKLRGYRIELNEVDEALRRATGSAFALAVPLPDSASPHELVGVVAESVSDEAGVLSRCSQTLPEYMVPSRLVCVPEFPTTASGKVDRAALSRIASAE